MNVVYVWNVYSCSAEFSSPPSFPLFPSLLPTSLSQAVPVQLSLDALLQMPGSQVRETMRRLGSSSEECGRLSAALSCLKTATESGRWTSRREALVWRWTSRREVLIWGWTYRRSPGLGVDLQERPWSGGGPPGERPWSGGGPTGERPKSGGSPGPGWRVTTSHSMWMGTRCHLVCVTLMVLSNPLCVCVLCVSSRRRAEGGRGPMAV